MLKLNKLADYATVVLASMAADPARRFNGQQLSDMTHLPAPTVAKLLKALNRGGLLHSTRGQHGGYQLARKPAQISVADVVRALEGPIALTDCAQHGGGCDLSNTCRSRNSFRLIDDAIQQALAAVTLDQMVGPPPREIALTFYPAAHSASSA